MILIDYNEGEELFECTFDKRTRLERDKFDNLIRSFKQFYLFYNPKNHAWTFSEGREDEILARFSKAKIDYVLSAVAQNAIERIKQSYTRESKYFRNRIFDEAILPEGVTAFNFQKDIINWKIKRNCLLDAGDSGTGKTFTTITHLSLLKQCNDIDGVIIIVPSGLDFHWQYQLLEFSTQFKEEDIQIITNEDKQTIFERYKDKKVLIFPYHILKDILLSYKADYKFGQSAKRIKWKKGSFCNIKELWNKKSIASILDESHMIKSNDAIKTKALLSIKPYFDYRFALSATPNIHGFEEIYSQIKFVDASVIPMSYYAFLLYISDVIGDKFDRWKIKRYNTENVNKVKTSLNQVMIQVLKKDLAEMKTQKIVTPIYLKMTPLQKELYKLIAEEEINKLYEEFDQITWKLILNKFPYLLKVVDAPAYLKSHTFDNPLINKTLDKWKIDDDPKIVVLDSMLQDIIEYRDEKIIISDTSPFILDMLYERYKKYNPLIIHGSLADEKDAHVERQEKVEKFNTDPKYKIFFLSSLTSARGLNLQYMCHRILFYSMPNDAEKWWQLQDRTCRITSTIDTDIKYFTYPYSIDAVRVHRTLARIDLEEKLGKEVSQSELTNLLRGIC